MILADFFIIGRRSEIKIGEFVNKRRVNNSTFDIIIREKREEVKVIDRSRLHTNDSRGEVIRRNSFKFREEGMEAFRGLRERFLGEDISFRTFNTREEGFFRDINNNEEFKRHRLDTSFLRLGKAEERASRSILHSYTGFAAQPTYSGLRSRKQTPRRASIARVLCMFSCFSNFNINLFYQKLLIGGVYIA